MNSWRFGSNQQQRSVFVVVAVQSPVGEADRSALVRPHTMLPKVWPDFRSWAIQLPPFALVNP